MASLLAKMAPIARAMEYAREKKRKEEELAFEKEKQAQELKNLALNQQIAAFNLDLAKEKAIRDKEKYKRENFFTGNEVIGQALTPSLKPASQELAAGTMAAAGAPFLPGSAAFAPGLAIPSMAQTAKPMPFTGPWTESTEKPRMIPLSEERKAAVLAEKEKQKMALEELKFFKDLEKEKYRQDRMDTRAKLQRATRGTAGSGKGKTPKEPKAPKGTLFTGVGEQQPVPLPTQSLFGPGVPNVSIPAASTVPLMANRLNGNVLSIPGFGNVTLQQYSKLSDQEAIPYQQAAGQGGIPQAWEVARKTVSGKSTNVNGTKTRTQYIEMLRRKLAAGDMDQITADEMLRSYDQFSGFGGGAIPGSSGNLEKLMGPINEFLRRGQ